MMMNESLAQELERVEARRRLPPPSRLRALREKVGLKQMAVARVLEVSAPAVCRWEAGLRKPRGKILDAYLELLDKLAAEATKNA